jgi:hypothetical protein
VKVAQPKGPTRSRDGFHKECLALVKPSSEREAACLAEFDVMVDATKLANGADDGRMAPGEIIAEAKAFAEKLAGLLARRLSGPAGKLVAVSLCGVDLERLKRVEHELAITVMKFSEANKKPGSHALKYAKEAAAHLAYGLLASYSLKPKKRAPMTKHGPFLQLASLIFEAATGAPDADLTRYCRRVFDEKRTRAPQN